MKYMTSESSLTHSFLPGLHHQRCHRFRRHYLWKHRHRNVSSTFLYLCSTTKLSFLIARVNGLRIKTDATATGSIVENVIYENNKLSGITEFGVLIDQSYPSTLGTPGTGVIIEVITERSFHPLTLTPQILLS